MAFEDDVEEEAPKSKVVVPTIAKEEIVVVPPKIAKIQVEE
jgi:hypothetical protein